MEAYTVRSQTLGNRYTEPRCTDTRNQHPEARNQLPEAQKHCTVVQQNVVSVLQNTAKTRFFCSKTMGCAGFCSLSDRNEYLV